MMSCFYRFTDGRGKPAFGQNVPKKVVRQEGPVLLCIMVQDRNMMSPYRTRRNLEKGPERENEIFEYCT
jgi:hypothetical protein